MASSFNLMPEFEQIPNVKVSYNIGALLDIPTGMYVKGKYGESILNGGLGAVTGIVGIGNNFKSTILNFMMLTAMSHFDESKASTYDTEVNIQEHVLRRIASRIDGFHGVDIIDEGRWLITDKTKHLGNEWFELWKKSLAHKNEIISKILRTSPFLGRDNKTLIKLPILTLTALDSITEFQTQDTAGILDKNELGDSGANTVHMRQGLSKMLLLSEVPRLVGAGNNPLLLTAHVGKDIPMDPRAAPVKKLQYLKNNDKIKGVTDKFMFLTTNCWQCQNAAPLQNRETKAPEYPKNSDDDNEGDTDLNVVTLVSLRNKNGPSGIVIQILVSQREGVLPSLTEFHYIRTNDYYGMTGSKIHYSLDLLPDVKLSRTTIREKIENNDKVRRALNITAEMCQMYYMDFDMLDELKCTPKQLYDDLKAMGYDWDVLLSTRGWWTFDNDKQSVPFLSTMDLLRARKGLYSIYWLDENKQIKPEFINKINIINNVSSSEAATAS